MLTKNSNNSIMIIINGIIKYILENNLKPGDKLPTEVKLMEILSVSRSSLREALSVLAVMRIIKVVQGSGSYLCDHRGATMLYSYNVYLNLGVVSFEELYELRIQLEANAAELAARRITLDLLKRMEQCIKSSFKNLHDEEVFFTVDREFHNIIYQACQNKLLTMNLESMREIVDYYRVRTVHYHEIRKSAHGYHNRILEAFKNRDSAYARMCMIDHLTEVKRAGELHDVFKKYEGGSSIGEHDLRRA